MFVCVVVCVRVAVDVPFNLTTSLTLTILLNLTFPSTSTDSFQTTPLYRSSLTNENWTSPSSLFIASNGLSLRVYQAVFDARFILNDLKSSIRKVGLSMYYNTIHTIDKIQKTIIKYIQYNTINTIYTIK